jgi:hypothetical protein
MDKPRPKTNLPVTPSKPSQSAAKNIFTMASYNAEQLKKQVALQTSNMVGMGILMKTREMRTVSKYAPHQGAREIARRKKQSGISS